MKGRTVVLLTAGVLVLRWIWLAVWCVNFPYADQWYTDPHIVRAIAGEESLGLFDFWLGYNNEHRILLHRLMAYAVIAVTGCWDSVAMMYVQAVFAVLPLGLWLTMLRRTTGFDRLSVVVVVTAFALPLGPENMLWGFQSQFYVLVVFAMLLAMAASRRDLRRPSTFVWLMALAVLGYLNIACGVFCFAMVALAYGIDAYRTRSWRRHLVPIGLAMAAMAGTLLAIPHAFVPDPHKARSIGRFFEHFAKFAAWPVGMPFVGLALVASLGRRLRTIVVEDPVGRFVLLLAAWIVCSMAMLGYGRSEVSNRYVDLLLVSVLALLVLLDAAAPTGRLRKLVSIWKVGVVVAFVGYFATASLKMVDHMRGSQLERLENARAALDLLPVDPIAAKARFAKGPLPIDDVELAWAALLVAQRTGQLPPPLAPSVR